MPYRVKERKGFVMLQYSRELQERYHVDVFVAGGGAAGVAAAVAAARQGKKVFLAEAAGCFGGVGTSGLVPSFAPFDDGVHVLASGIGYEIRKAVSKEIPLNTYWTPLNVEELKREYDRIMVESGVVFRFFTTLCDVKTRGECIDYVVLCGKSGMFAVKARIYIDCTGDGDLCAFAGGKYEVGDENGNVMPSTLCSLWSNVDVKRARDIGIGKQGDYIEKAYKEGILTYEDRHLTGMFVHDNGMSGGNIGHLFGMNPLDEKSLTDGMVWGRKSMVEYERYYKTYLEGFENMVLCATGALPGVRESRRITCDYTLCGEDFINRADFEDEIGRYCYPVDIHIMNTSEDEFKRFSDEYDKLRYKKGESYGIPYRSLIPVSFSNVLVAGRCMGTDRNMQASVRVMPGCFITGQAAGVAAALAVAAGDTRKVDYNDLKNCLRKSGAFIR